ncbi:hypothetical protein L9F63_014095, partial [Diploptera punctata]
SLRLCSLTCSGWHTRFGLPVQNERVVVMMMEVSRGPLHVYSLLWFVLFDINATRVLRLKSGVSGLTSDLIAWIIVFNDSRNERTIHVVLFVKPGNISAASILVSNQLLSLSCILSQKSGLFIKCRGMRDKLLKIGTVPPKAERLVILHNTLIIGRKLSDILRPEPSLNLSTSSLQLSRKPSLKKKKKKKKKKKMTIQLSVQDVGVRTLIAGFSVEFAKSGGKKTVVLKKAVVHLFVTIVRQALVITLIHPTRVLLTSRFMKKIISLIGLLCRNILYLK